PWSGRRRTSGRCRSRGRRRASSGEENQEKVQGKACRVTQQSTAKTVVQDTLVDDGRPKLEEIVVGKDVLELVSSAMYVDPLTVYREYVQNSADAIDDAKRRGEITEGKRGRVDIAIDPNSRTVRIRDNGSGIAWEEFTKKLTALGA